jgi:anaphase-promoting complex subunit 4
MGLESSKAVHHIRVCDTHSEQAPAASAALSPGEAAGKIEFIAWSRNVAGERARRKERKMRRMQRGADDLRMLLDGDRTGDVAADLPHELTFLEIETALPKLSPLPVSGGSG